MVAPTLVRLIAKLFARPQSRRDRRRAARLGLEALEGRDVPAVTFTVDALSNAAEGGGAGEFRVTANGDSSDFTNAVCAIVSLGGTATYTTDYSASQAHYSYMTFNSPGATATLTITPVDDSSVEGTESVTLTVQRFQMFPTGPTASDSMTLSDNDYLPVVSIVAVDHAVEGGTVGTFRFSRTGSTSSSLTITYTVETTGPAYATAGTDYTALSGSLTIPSGYSTADVDVTASVNADDLPLEFVALIVDTSTAYDVGTSSVSEIVIWETDPVAGSSVISGITWTDTDSDGERDSGEPVVGTVGVWLLLDGEVILTTTSDEEGEYQFENLAAGEYTVRFVVESGQAVTAPESGELPISLDESEEVDDADGGIGTASGTSSIGNLVWHDDDDDGIQDVGETGVEGAVADLYVDGDVVPTATTTTDVDGYYRFEDLAPGDYSVVITPPLGTLFATSSTGLHSIELEANEDDNSADAACQPVVTPTITLNQPTVNGQVISGGGSFDPGGAFTSITFFAAQSNGLAGGGLVRKTEILTQPGNRMWSSSTESLPKGKFVVWAVLVSTIGGQTRYTISRSYTIDVTTGTTAPETGGITFLPLVGGTGLRFVEAQRFRANVELNATWTISTPTTPTGYTVHEAVAWLTTGTGGVASSQPLVQEEGVEWLARRRLTHLTGRPPIVSRRPGWVVPNDPAVTEYTLSAVVVFKKTGSPDLTYLSGFQTVTVPNN